VLNFEATGEEPLHLPNHGDLDVMVERLKTWI
jgi:hypothetical protein